MQTRDKTKVLTTGCRYYDIDKPAHSVGVDSSERYINCLEGSSAGNVPPRNGGRWYDDTWWWGALPE